MHWFPALVTRLGLAVGPDLGWELVAWIGTKNGRRALASALTDMIASERTNFSGRYQLGLK